MTESQALSEDQAASVGPARAGAATTTRRAMLVGAGAVGTSALLAACGTDADDDRPAGAGDATPDSGGGATTAPAAPASGDATPGPGAGSGTRLGATGDIPQDGGRIFAEQQVVITQPASGTFKGFSAICTHQTCTVSTVADGTIICACHGSQFSIADGSVRRGPATQPLAEVAIRVDDDAVWLG